MGYPNDHYEANKSMFTKANMVYSTGFFITSCYDVLQKVMQQANDEDKPMLFNISAVFLVDFFKDQTVSALSTLITFSVMRMKHPLTLRLLASPVITREPKLLSTLQRSRRQIKSVPASPLLHKAPIR